MKRDEGTEKLVDDPQNPFIVFFGQSFGQGRQEPLFHYAAGFVILAGGSQPSHEVAHCIVIERSQASARGDEGRSEKGIVKYDNDVGGYC